MKKIYNIILVFIGIAGLFSCEDYLDRPPIADLDPQNFFRSESEIRAATLNAYIYLDSERQLQQEHFTDNCFGKKNSDAISYTHGTHTPALSIFKTVWEDSYKGIAQTNLVINAEIGEGLSQEIINNYFGDAYFMRAYYYAELLFHYGEVPIITGSPSVTGDMFPAKNSMIEVKQQILNDLTEALIDLPVDPEKGRASAGAAHMLKTRVHMFFDEFDAAKNAAKAVIDLQKYQLFDDFRSLFYAENENSNDEVIFSIQHIASLRNNNFYQRITNGTQYSPSLSLANEFEMANGMAIDEVGSGFDPQLPYLNRDPRLNATILIPGDSKIIGGVPTPTIGRAPKSKTGMLCDKYANWEESYEFYNGSDFILMRYADLLLLYAEALNEVGGPSQGVYDAVNEVRARVALPELANGLSKDEMRSKIRHERRVELAMEGQRLFDIFRWDIGSEVFVALDGYDPNKLKKLDNLVFKEKLGVDKDRSFNLTKGYFWPIPLTEIDLNENLIQNPGFN